MIWTREVWVQFGQNFNQNFEKPWIIYRVSKNYIELSYWCELPFGVIHCYNIFIEHVIFLLKLVSMRIKWHDTTYLVKNDNVMKKL